MGYIADACMPASEKMRDWNKAILDGVPHWSIWGLSPSCFRLAKKFVREPQQVGDCHLSSPAAGMAGQAVVRWEGITQVQQASSAAVKAWHCPAVNLQGTLADEHATHLQDMHCCSITGAIFGKSHVSGLKSTGRQPIIRSTLCSCAEALPRLTGNVCQDISREAEPQLHAHLESVLPELLRCCIGHKAVLTLWLCAEVVLVPATRKLALAASGRS